MYTVMILNFWADMPRQTVQTQIRLLLLIKVYSVCHSVCIVWTHYSMVESHCSNFRVITTNILGVRLFRNLTVGDQAPPTPRGFKVLMLSIFLVAYLDFHDIACLDFLTIKEMTKVQKQLLMLFLAIT